MSALMVSENHIHALIDVAAFGPQDRGPRYPGDGWHTPTFRYPCAGAPFGVKTLDPRHEPDLIGVWLWAENAASVAYRYDEPAQDTYTYQFVKPKRRLTLVEALKAVDCYEYQSCEHPDWPASPAKVFCAHLRSALISQLPGYSDAAWDID